LFLLITIITLTLATALFFIARHWLPFLAASAGSSFDHQLHLTLFIFGAAFLIVQFALAIFIWKSRHQDARKLGHYSHGWPAFEIGIMLLTAAVFFGLGIKGGALSVAQPKLTGPEAMQIEVTGMQ